MAQSLVALQLARSTQLLLLVSHFSVGAQSVRTTHSRRAPQKAVVGITGSPLASRLAPLGSGTGSPPCCTMSRSVRHSKPSRQSLCESHFSMQKRSSMERGAQVLASV